MKEKSGSRLMKDGRKVFTKAWLPDRDPRVNIILVHGIGEHCERYGPVAKILTGNNYAVYGFDHIGHGKSDGKRGCMSYNDAFSIINSLKGELLEQSPEIPLIIYGHSMGGGIVLSYGTKYPEKVAGIIATSPAVGLANLIRPEVVKLLRVIKKVTPNLTVSNGLSLDGLCHDKTILESYEKDPLCHDKVSVTLGLDLMDWGNYLSAYDKVYPVPLFVAQGSADTLVNPVATEKFAQKLKGNVTYKRFEGGFHELHNEPNKQELFDAAIRWIDRITAKQE